MTEAILVGVAVGVWFISNELSAVNDYLMRIAIALERLHEEQDLDV